MYFRIYRRHPGRDETGDLLVSNDPIEIESRYFQMVHDRQEGSILIESKAPDIVAEACFSRPSQPPQSEARGETVATRRAQLWPETGVDFIGPTPSQARGLAKWAGRSEQEMAESLGVALSVWRSYTSFEHPKPVEMGHWICLLRALGLLDIRAI